MQKDSGEKIEHSFEVKEYGKNPPSIYDPSVYICEVHACVCMLGGGMFALCVFICGWQKSVSENQSKNRALNTPRAAMTAFIR